MPLKGDHVPGFDGIHVSRGPYGSASFSEDRHYRYSLERRYMPLLTQQRPVRHVTWIMLNPSRADGETDDMTIRKCSGFCARWGYHEFMVINLFALIATDPAELISAPDPVGIYNDSFVSAAITRAAAGPDNLLIAAWGGFDHPLIMSRVLAVRALVEGAGLKLQSLGCTRNGAPHHPSRISYTTPRTPWPR